MIIYIWLSNSYFFFQLNANFHFKSNVILKSSKTKQKYKIIIFLFLIKSIVIKIWNDIISSEISCFCALYREEGWRVFLGGSIAILLGEG